VLGRYDALAIEVTAGKSPTTSKYLHTRDRCSQQILCLPFLPNNITAPYATALGALHPLSLSHADIPDDSTLHLVPAHQAPRPLSRNLDPELPNLSNSLLRLSCQAQIPWLHHVQRGLQHLPHKEAAQPWRSGHSPSYASLRLRECSV
jgi:hypothetical protein